MFKLSCFVAVVFSCTVQKLCDWLREEYVPERWKAILLHLWQLTLRSSTILLLGWQVTTDCCCWPGCCSNVSAACVLIITVIMIRFVEHHMQSYRGFCIVCDKIIITIVVVFFGRLCAPTSNSRTTSHTLSTMSRLKIVQHWYVVSQ